MKEKCSEEPQEEFRWDKCSRKFPYLLIRSIR
jgi:hypothetical protein